MKKLVIAIFSLLLLSGCGHKAWEPVECEDGSTVYVRKFVYEEHQYIQFYQHKIGFDKHTGFVHDPDCQTCMIDYD